jgi:hypothetical protein
VNSGVLQDQLTLLATNGDIMDKLLKWRRKYGKLTALPPAAHEQLWGYTAPWVYANIRQTALARGLSALRVRFERLTGEHPKHPVLASCWDALVLCVLGTPDDALTKLSTAALMRAVRETNPQVPGEFRAQLKGLGVLDRVKAILAEVQTVWPEQQEHILATLDRYLHPTAARGTQHYTLVVGAADIPRLRAACERTLADVRRGAVQGIGYSDILDIVPRGRDRVLVISNRELAPGERMALAQILNQLAG